MKYILVTGGVCSGIGKGVVTSSIAKLLQSCGIHVTAIKIDPYINIDAGTFSPYEHGEVYVLDDGGEVDLDLGNYERFLDITLSKDNNLTTGKLDQLVINRERTGDYLGKTVQAIPHKTKEIQEWVKRVAHIPVTKDGQCPEVCVIELGGTIGDIDGMIYVYAFREFAFATPKDEFCCVHVSLVPQLKTSGESKTKPTQKSVSELRQFGLEPDLIICRSENIFEEDIKTKISDSCVIKIEQVICLPDLSSIYKVPIVLEEQKVVSFLNERLQLNVSMSLLKTAIQPWKALIWKMDNCSNNLIEIALVGKYTKLKDSYASLVKAIQHACIAFGSTPSINYIEASNLELKSKQSNPVQYHEAWQNLCKSSGVIVPGGFGERGFEGMIEACHWCRENGVPFLGICLGFQVAVVEFARNVLNISDANSIEMNNNTKNPIIIEMPEHHTGQMGGTLRLGLSQSIFNRDCILKKFYKKDTIEERHRHRYEVNNAYITSFEKAGLEFVATDLSGERMEIFELKDHRFYLATQFHPEYLSRPLKPSPVFLSFILACLNKLKWFMLKGCNLSPIMMSDVDSTDDVEQVDSEIDF